MANRGVILFMPEAGRPWRLGFAGEAARVEALSPAADAPQAVAAAVAAALQSVGDEERRLVLAPRATACFSARLGKDAAESEAKAGSRAWRRAMLFALEERLPLAAEDVVADFIPGERGVFAVCAETATLRPWVEALDAAGVGVAAITPAALLLAQRRLSDAADALLLGEADRLHLVTLERGSPAAWHLVSPAEEDVLGRLALLEPEKSSWRVLAEGVAPSLRARLLEAGVAVAAADGDRPSLEERAAQVAAELLTEEAQPLIDLRRDALAARDTLRGVREPALAAAIAVVALLVVFSASMLLAAYRADAEVEELQAAQREVYRELMPGQRVPENVARRLASEQQAIAARAGSAGGLPSGASALVVLRDLFQSLPGDAVFRLDRVRVDGDGAIEVLGQTRSYEEAGVISDALRREAAFDTEPPRSAALREGGGVSFTIRGQYLRGEQPTRPGVNP